MSSFTHTGPPSLVVWSRLSKVQERPTPGVTQSVTYMINTLESRTEDKPGNSKRREAFWEPLSVLSQRWFLIRSLSLITKDSAPYQAVIGSLRAVPRVQIIWKPVYQELISARESRPENWPCLVRALPISRLRHFFISSSVSYCQEQLLWPSIEASERAKFRTHGKLQEQNYHGLETLSSIKLILSLFLHNVQMENVLPPPPKCQDYRGLPTTSLMACWDEPRPLCRSGKRKKLCYTPALCLSFYWKYPELILLS